VACPALAATEAWAGNLEILYLVRLQLNLLSRIIESSGLACKCV
jgi:hypothetical protein